MEKKLLGIKINDGYFGKIQKLTRIYRSFVLKIEWFGSIKGSDKKLAILFWLFSCCDPDEREEKERKNEPTDIDVTWTYETLNSSSCHDTPRSSYTRRCTIHNFYYSISVEKAYHPALDKVESLSHRGIKCKRSEIQSAVWVGINGHISFME